MDGWDGTLRGHARLRQAAAAVAAQCRPLKSGRPAAIHGSEVTMHAAGRQSSEGFGRDSGRKQAPDTAFLPSNSHANLARTAHSCSGAIGGSKAQLKTH